MTFHLGPVDVVRGRRLAGAIASAVVAAVAAGGCRPGRWCSCGRARSAQKVLLAGETEDIVDFAVSLQGRIDDLHRSVDEIAGGLGRVDRRVDDCLQRSSLVRYDAYEESGGHQSASVAFLDASRSGIVLSAIQGRDYARIYVKELDHGRATVALSPEEQAAVERAMAGELSAHRARAVPFAVVGAQLLAVARVVRELLVEVRRVLDLVLRPADEQPALLERDPLD